MLNSLRGSGQSKVMWIIMGLLMLGLTGFGIGGLGGGTIRNIGTVGDEEIPINTYARGYRNAAAQMSQRAGRQLSPAELQIFGVQQQVLDAVVNQAALDNETTKRGLSVGDSEVRKSILRNPQFQGLNGEFDQAQYDFYLDRQLGLSPSEFEALLRKEKARSLLETAVIGGVEGPDVAAMALLKYAQQERSLEWVALREADLGTKIGDPDEAELKTFYDNNSDSYMSPLTRNVTYAWLNPSSLLDQVNVDDTKIRASYDSQPERFNKPEMRAVDRLVFPNLADAQKARDRIDSGAASFSEVITERGLKEADVDMGEIERGGLSKAAGDLIFGEDGPGVVGPVESSLGPALFRINAVMAADNTPFEEARDELRDELAGEAARRLVNELAIELDDRLAAGATLEELKGEPGITVGKMGYFKGSEEPLAAYEKFRDAVEKAAEGDFPELVFLSDGGVFALRLDSIQEPALIPMADVREKLVSDWREAAVNKALKSLAEKLKPGLEKGGDLSVLGLEMTAVDGISRNAFVEAVPPSTVTEVFKLELGKVAIVDGGDAVFLVRLTNITEFDPDLEGNDKILARVKERLGGQTSLDMLELFSADIQSRAGVQLNRAAINQVNNQVSGQ